MQPEALVFVRRVHDLPLILWRQSKAEQYSLSVNLGQTNHQKSTYSSRQAHVMFRATSKAISRLRTVEIEDVGAHCILDLLLLLVFQSISLGGHGQSQDPTSVSYFGSFNQAAIFCFSLHSLSLSSIAAFRHKVSVSDGTCHQFLLVRTLP